MGVKFGLARGVKTKLANTHGDGIPAENIASELEMSKSLVRQYVEIINDLAEMKKG